jgi:hypothetical protein
VYFGPPLLTSLTIAKRGVRWSPVGPLPPLTP